MVKTTIRYSKEINLTNTLRKNLQNLFGEDAEFIGAHYSNKEIYHLRITALHEAMGYVIENIPAKSRFKRKDIEAFLKDAAELPEDKTVDFYQKKLLSALNQCVNVLVQYWFNNQSNKKEEALELLGTAEQYQLMERGRNHVATLSIVPAYSSEKIIIRYMESLPACPDETLEELKQIKAFYANEESLRLPLPAAYQMCFLYHLKEENFTYEKIKEALLNWQKKLDSGVANKSITDASLLPLTEDNRKNYPPFFNRLARHEQEMLLEIICPPHVLSVGSIKKHTQEFLNKIDKWREDKVPISHIQQARKLPFWYLYLPQNSRLFLNNILRRHDDIAPHFAFAPSTQREIPLASNNKRAQLIVTDLAAQTIYIRSPFRNSASHVVPRGAELNKPGRMALMHCTVNLKHLMSLAPKNKDALIVNQTLISPSKIATYFTSAVPDWYLDRIRLAACSNLGLDVCMTNHPFNMFKYIAPTPANEPQCNMILRLAFEKVSSSYLKREMEDQSIEPTKELIFLIDTLRSQLRHALNIKVPPENLRAWTQLLHIKPPKTRNLSFKEAIGLIDKAILNESIREFELESHRSKKENELFNYLNKFMSAFKSQNFDCKPILAYILYLHSNGLDKELRFIKRVVQYAYRIKAYHMTLNSPMGTGTVRDYQGRELFLASQEILLADYSFGGCMSAKDRKADETEHTDCMILVEDLFGEAILFLDYSEVRSVFVEIFASLQIDGHHQYMAHTNTKGVFGTRTPYVYLPGDTCTAIRKKKGNPKALEEEERIAKNNELGKIGKLSTKVEHVVDYHTAANKLNPDEQKLFVDLLYTILNDPSKFKKKINLQGITFLNGYTNPLGGPAQGVSDMLDILGGKYSTTLCEIITNIYKIAVESLNVEKHRSTNALTLYTAIKNIYLSKHPGAHIESELEPLMNTLPSYTG